MHRCNQNRWNTNRRRWSHGRTYIWSFPLSCNRSFGFPFFPSLINFTTDLWLNMRLRISIQIITVWPYLTISTIIVTSPRWFLFVSWLGVQMLRHVIQHYKISLLFRDWEEEEAYEEEEVNIFWVTRSIFTGFTWNRSKIWWVCAKSKQDFCESGNLRTKKEGFKHELGFLRIWERTKKEKANWTKKVEDEACGKFSDSLFLFMHVCLVVVIICRW